MRVLLLGATGNLGSRCLPALIAHKHTVTVFVRNVPKLRSIMSSALLEQVNAIVQGDVTDSAALKKAVLDHDIEGIIDVAGNVVPPWKEYLLPKIASAVGDAAIAVGRERGKPLRAWITSGIGIMQYPGTKYELQDYLPKFAHAQHQATRTVVEEIPTSDLRWTLIAVSMMYPSDPKQGPFEPLNVPQSRDFLVGGPSPPGWEKTWMERLPLIGPYLNVVYALAVMYRARYEVVADALAEDLEKNDSEWIGKKVAVKDISRKGI